jgi:hypothetical protein
MFGLCGAIELIAARMISGELRMSIKLSLAL